MIGNFKLIWLIKLIDYVNIRFFFSFQYNRFSFYQNESWMDDDQNETSCYIVIKHAVKQEHNCCLY